MRHTPGWNRPDVRDALIGGNIDDLGRQEGVILKNHVIVGADLVELRAHEGVDDLTPIAAKVSRICVVTEGR